MICRGDRNKQIEGARVTFEDMALATPYGRNAPLLTKIDHLVQELIAKRNAEDVSSYAQFFPGIITKYEEVDNAPEEPQDVPNEADGSHDVPSEPGGESDAKVTEEKVIVAEDPDSLSKEGIYEDPAFVGQAISVPEPMGNESEEYHQV